VTIGDVLFKHSDGTTLELTVPEVHQTGVKIVCNPFFLRFWPQHPDNLTLMPSISACNLPREHSWRRMLLTSPSVTSLRMKIGCVHSPPLYLSISLSPSLRRHSHNLCQILTSSQERRIRGPPKPQVRRARHQPRTHGRDAWPRCGHDRTASQKARVSLDAAVRLCFLGAFDRCCRAAAGGSRGEES
jgi:hypothetical protein